MQLATLHLQPSNDPGPHLVLFPPREGVESCGCCGSCGCLLFPLKPANSHQYHFVGLTISVVLTYQGDISELFIMGLMHSALQHNLLVYSDHISRLGGIGALFPGSRRCWA